MKQCLVNFSILCLILSLSSEIVEAQDRICFNLHNSLVDKYLTNADNTYTNTIGRNGTSILEDYDEYISLVGHDYPFQKSNWAEQPAPVKLEGVQGSKVLISTSPFFSSIIEFPIESDGTVTAYNLIPQSIYWYKAVDSNNVTISSGVFKTKGHVRMIRVENVMNVRDLGGWKCGEGFRIAYGKLYRGATLDGIHSTAIVPVENRLKISDVDAEMMANLCGIKAEVDLRGDKGEHVRTSSLIPGASVKYYTASGYKYLITQGSFKETQKCLNHIASNLTNGKPTYFHCEWGADRTGSLAMIIGAICGVSESDLVKDWEMTSFANYWDFKIISDVKESDNMRAMFQTLYDKYGGADGASIQEQVISWLTQTVYKNKVSSSWTAEAVIAAIQNNLVEADVQSPKLIRDWSDKYDEFKYSVVTDEQTTYSNTEDFNKYLLATGKTAVSDMCCVSGWIDCSGYTHLLVNLKCNLVCVFYDKNKKKISTVTYSNVAAGTVLMENVEKTIPSNAKYVRFNIPKYSGFTAVLSNKSYLE